MTEEEKKAIQELKEEINKPVEVPEDKFDTFILYNIENAKILLSIVENKQQICNEELITQDYVQENFISKEKIRELLKEKEKQYEIYVGREYSGMGELVAEIKILEKILGD